MDNKRLLEQRPPAYSPAPPEGYGQQPQGYGTLGQPPPPYLYNSPPPAGFVPLPPPQHHPYPNTYTIIQQPVTTTSVVVVGGCPACRVGVLEDAFTCCGIFCAIVFFPIGILFCLLLRQRRCPNCGATFG